MERECRTNPPWHGMGCAVGWRQSRRAPTGVPLAGAYSNFHSNQVLIALQNEAKQAPRGLWAQSNPTPPWEWRKQHPSTFSTQPNAAVSSVTAHANTTCLLYTSDAADDLLCVD